MKLQHTVYHENNLEKPYIPQEDFYNDRENVFVVADGVAHDLVDGFYPNPSASAKVAEIICDTIITELTDTDKELGDLKKALWLANDKVRIYNEHTDLYRNRENNGYTIGAAVLSVIIIKENRLLYAVLDDCFFSIFSNDLVDHPILKSYVENSAKYYNAHYDWSRPDDRKVWRKEFRNNTQMIDNKPLGYGAIDGRLGFERFVQYGEEEISNGDLICLYTDGFIKIMKDINFIKSIKENEFTMDTLTQISNYTKDKNITKEKTCYFIKYLD